LNAEENKNKNRNYLKNLNRIRTEIDGS